MKLAVVESADRYSKLVADLKSHRTLLSKFDVVGVGRGSAADQTRLRGDKSQVAAVPLPYRLVDDADLRFRRPNWYRELDAAAEIVGFGGCFTTLELA